MKQKTILWLSEPEYSHLTVMDPDGWDRSSVEAFEKSWDEEIDRAEFERRLMFSTTMGFVRHD